MSKTFPMVPLETALRHRSNFIEIDDLEIYKRCRVQLHAQGIIERDVVPGSEIKTKKQQVCHAKEFLVAEIDAKLGGFGIVPKALDGAIVSSHYFLFTIDETVLDQRFLDFVVRTPTFMTQVRAKGTTNYAAIRPNDILQYENAYYRKHWMCIFGLLQSGLSYLALVQVQTLGGDALTHQTFWHSNFLCHQCRNNSNFGALNRK